MAGRTVSRTAHFALHRSRLDSPAVAGAGAPESRDGCTAGPGSAGPQALFAVQEPWIGALVPKRWAKRAVTRNAIKRQIYAVSQHTASHLPVAAHVVRLRAAFDRQHFVSATSPALKKAVRSELEQLFAGARA